MNCVTEYDEMTERNNNEKKNGFKLIDLFAFVYAASISFFGHLHM